MVSSHYALTAAIKRHFSMDKGILFPAFERASGSAAGGPTGHGHERAQMRELFGRLDRARPEGNTNAYLGEADTLLIPMQ